MNQEHSVVLCSLAQGDLLKNRRARALDTTGLGLMLAVALGGIARAQMAPVPRPLKFALLPVARAAALSAYLALGDPWRIL
jgi:hypothetical protein